MRIHRRSIEEEEEAQAQLETVAFTTEFLSFHQFFRTFSDLPSLHLSIFSQTFPKDKERQKERKKAIEKTIDLQKSFINL